MSNLKRNTPISKTKLIFYGIVLGVIIFATIMFKSASFRRSLVDIKSDYIGLDRTINVYTADGDLIASYSGKIDIDSEDGGAIKFDYNGKRYIYYNCFVETIADIN